MPKMASSIDDVFEFMGIQKAITHDKSIIPVDGHLLKRCADRDMALVIMKAYSLGYTDAQIYSMCLSKGFDIEKYLLPPEKDDSDTVFSTDSVDTKTDAEVDTSLNSNKTDTQPKITIITSSGIVRTLQIFCEMKTSTIPADACVKCKNLDSISYEAMQVVCKYDPTQETT